MSSGESLYDEARGPRSQVRRHHVQEWDEDLTSFVPDEWWPSERASIMSMIGRAPSIERSKRRHPSARQAPPASDGASPAPIGRALRVVR